MEERLGFLEVGGIKSFGEPVIDRGKQVVGVLTFVLVLPEPGQTHGGAQLPPLRLRTAGEIESLPEAGFCLRRIGHGLAEQ